MSVDWVSKSTYENSNETVIQEDPDGTKISSIAFPKDALDMHMTNDDFGTVLIALGVAGCNLEAMPNDNSGDVVEQSVANEWGKILAEALPTMCAVEITNGNRPDEEPDLMISILGKFDLAGFRHDSLKVADHFAGLRGDPPPSATDDPAKWSFEEVLLTHPDGDEVRGLLEEAAEFLTKCDGFYQW